MYAGGNILEDFAVARAERDLHSLIDRAPKIAHRRVASTVADVPIEQVAIGDDILVRAGEVIPVDGVITSPVATLDEAAVTGEPIPVSRKAGELARSGSLNAGDTFEIRASASANESTYAGNFSRRRSTATTPTAPPNSSRMRSASRAHDPRTPGKFSHEIRNSWCCSHLLCQFGIISARGR
jgi:P-type E1-E2 ATPase